VTQAPWTAAPAATTPMTATTAPGMKTASQLAFLSRALRAPAIRDSFERLAAAAGEQGWSHEEYLAAVLSREVTAREAHGAQARIRRAGFPAVKTLEEFDFAHAGDLDRELVVHLGMADFVAARSNVVLLGPPGTGKTHLAIALAIRAAQAGHKVAFATASHWVMRLSRAHNTHGLKTELRRLARIPLLVLDEVGYIPFDTGAANLIFHLVASRYETAATIVTSNRAFSRWGDIFADEVVAAAIVDRLVHHADVIALNGDSYRLAHRRPSRTAPPNQP
jgi:DNA replication protein DnaC